MFKPLTKDNIGGIIELLIVDVNKRLKDKKISIALTDAARSYIVDNGYDPIYGARPLKRFVQKNVETLAGKLILSDGISEGETILIDYDENGLTARAV